MAPAKCSDEKCVFGNSGGASVVKQGTFSCGGAGACLVAGQGQGWSWVGAWAGHGLVSDPRPAQAHAQYQPKLQPMTSPGPNP